MATMWKPDQTFYPSPKMAMSAPGEKLAYVVVLNPEGNGTPRPDALAVMDVDPDSSTYLDVVGRVELNVGDEVHHFGWNACSAALCPYAPTRTLNAGTCSCLASSLRTSTSSTRKGTPLSRRSLRP